MYSIKNNGSYPIIIRDLNLHIAGGKTVDLDCLFKHDTVRRSVDLQNLISNNKLELVGKEKVEQIKTVVVKNIKRESQEDSKLLAELRSDLLEIKDILRSGKKDNYPSESVRQGYNDETIRQITDLQVRNLSENDSDIEKNFENIGQTIKKSEKLNDLLDVLDALDGKGE